MPSSVRLALGLVASGVLAAQAACVAGPDYRRPAMSLTTAYHGEPETAVSAGRSAELAIWWDSFDDPELTRVIARVSTQNLDLQAARARVLQSRAEAKAAGAALAPTIAAAGSAANVEQSLLSPIGAIGHDLPGFERRYDEYALGAVANWEIDLFGGLRRQREAARADAAAAQEQAAAIETSLAAEAADAYLQVRALQARIALATRQVAVQEALVDLLQRRTSQGVSAERELRQANAERERVRAALPLLQAALERQLNRLDVLMGAQAGTWRAELVQPGPLPAPPSLAGAGAPADLLRRRPDLLAAEHRLVAANARIGAAISDYYPKLSLTGLLGVNSIDAGQMFTGAALAQQVGAGLRWRLFDFGRIDAEVAHAKGAEAEALADYRGAVFRATEEVENAISDLAQAQARSRALALQVDELTVARGQAQQAYESGVTSLLEVRDADRDLLTASDQLVDARAAAARSAVAAFRALGGGWSASPPRPARPL